jgi:hypothetical protein
MQGMCTGDLTNYLFKPWMVDALYWPMRGFEAPFSHIGIFIFMGRVLRKMFLYTF